MTKRLILLCLLTAVVKVAFAQNNVTGRVVESDSREPMVQATVRLLKTDSTMVTGVVSDMNGNFKVKAPSAGRYILQITSVGYKTYTHNVTVTTDKDVALGTVSMKTDAIMLEGATVTKNIAKVTTSADTVIQGVLDIPENFHVLCILGIGHPADERKPQNEDKLKWENVHIDKF